MGKKIRRSFWFSFDFGERSISPTKIGIFRRAVKRAYIFERSVSSDKAGFVQHKSNTRKRKYTHVCMYVDRKPFPRKNTRFEFLGFRNVYRWVINVLNNSFLIFWQILRTLFSTNNRDFQLIYFKRLSTFKVESINIIHNVSDLEKAIRREIKIVSRKIVYNELFILVLLKYSENKK